MNIKHALNTAALAVTLAFAGAAHADDAYNHNAIVGSGGIVAAPGATLINPEPDYPFPAVSVIVYDMTNVSNPSQSYLAFCFQPEVVLGTTSSYTASYNVGTGTVSNAVRKLYETAYASTIGDSDKQISFQLALWELQADNSDLYSGAQAFALPDTLVTDAATMLTVASGHTLTNAYNYTIFNGVNADTTASQTLIGVSAVPEADTWAMLVAGLGLVGLVGRRKHRATDKFTA
ncbi:PEP-CTERM sorting domain-containing protein [Duganella sp. FT80W]|uniref:PEP-CTERM sorting domain-containing protein n=1 Tax=Duganella guangzhouensis TaxID=2666084 RepID=A0A6I2L7P5_9BURK|nr:PEP-CTERM sorting domain-containing protein [Duganella guangzhouensis]MRW93682.1 PEP-CTERM sorting domain-containing protein [Duganella guangzhouensis]